MNRRSSGASTSSLGSSLGSRNSRPCEYTSKAVQTTESLCRRIESVELGCGRGRTSHLTILRGLSSAPAQGHKIGGGCSPRISFLRTLIRCEWRLDCRSQWWELLSNLSTICATLLAFWLCNSFIICTSCPATSKMPCSRLDALSVLAGDFAPAVATSLTACNLRSTDDAARCDHERLSRRVEQRRDQTAGLYCLLECTFLSCEAARATCV